MAEYKHLITATRTRNLNPPNTHRDTGYYITGMMRDPEHRPQPVMGGSDQNDSQVSNQVAAKCYTEPTLLRVHQYGSYISTEHDLRETEQLEEELLQKKVS